MQVVLRSLLLPLLLVFVKGESKVYCYITGISTGGDISAKSPDYTTWFAVESFSDGFENQNSVGSQSAGAGAGKAQFQDLVITKQLNKISPLLMEAVSSGTLRPSMRCDFVTASPDPKKGKDLIYYQILLKDVLVSQVTQAWTPADAVPVETVTIRFAAASFTVHGQDSATGSESTVSFDQTSNAARRLHESDGSNKLRRE